MKGNEEESNDRVSEWHSRQVRVHGNGVGEGMKDVGMIPDFTRPLTWACSSILDRADIPVRHRGQLAVCCEHLRTSRRQQSLRTRIVGLPGGGKRSRHAIWASSSVGNSPAVELAVDAEAVAFGEPQSEVTRWCPLNLVHRFPLAEILQVRRAQRRLAAAQRADSFRKFDSQRLG